MSKKPEPKDLNSEMVGSQGRSAEKSIYNSADATYWVRAKEDLGKVRIEGDTSAPVGKYDFVALYPEQPGSDPNQGYLTYFYVESSTSLKTDETWGSGYWVAYGAWDYALDKYVKVVEAGPTEG
ncbi:MAG: hypothetical protein AAGN66_17275 [Acidobacteriota bacterium]